jgi:5'-nucleotidase
VEVLKSMGVRAIVVLLHEGGKGQVPYKGPTDPKNHQLRGKIVDIVNRLDDEVDVVISGHTHKFTNALLENQNHKKILVTQAIYHGEAFADIELILDKLSKDVVAKKAEIKNTDWRSVPVFENNSQKDRFIRYVSELTDQARQTARELISQKLRRPVKDTIGTASKEISKQPNESGESVLGNLVADAQRQAGRTNFAMTQMGGIRADSIGRGVGDGKGKITWGELFCVQPFGSKLVKLTLTGREVVDILKQQWAEAKDTRFLQVSGLNYSYYGNSPDDLTVTDCSGLSASPPRPLDPEARYTVTVSEFLAQGGDNFTAFKGKPCEPMNITDMVALFNYLESLPQPFERQIEGRIRNLDKKEKSRAIPSVRPALSLSSAWSNGGGRSLISY